jgi:hypothetical protein
VCCSCTGSASTAERYDHQLGDRVVEERLRYLCEVLGLADTSQPE